MFFSMIDGLILNKVGFNFMHGDVVLSKYFSNFDKIYCHLNLLLYVTIANCVAKCFNSLDI